MLRKTVCAEKTVTAAVKDDFEKKNPFVLSLDQS